MPTLIIDVRSGGVAVVFANKLFKVKYCNLSPIPESGVKSTQQ
jgi:hypothetical protein